MITRYAEWLKKAPSWIYKPAAQLWIDREFPRHLFIETTAACNLNCPHCPREKKTNHMDFGLFTSIIDEASTYGPRSFSLHLFGEPLLYPRILEAIEYIKNKDPHHAVLLTTNGTLLHRFIDSLIGLQVDKIIWTWRPEVEFSDSLIAKLYDWGHFMVRILKETIPDEEFKRWRKWPRVEIKHLHNYGGNVNTSRSSLRDTQSTRRWPCYHLWLAPAVSWNGSILICCNDPHHRARIGQLPADTISEAWKRMVGLRSEQLRNEYYGICKNCDAWRTYPDLFFEWQKS